MHALSALGAVEAAGAAVGLMTDERPALRRAAVEALGRLCADPAATAALRNAARDRDPALAAAAAAALQCRAPAVPVRCR
jgi:hypothetical protein